MTKSPVDYKRGIQSAGFDIYEPIVVGDETHWIPTPVLQELLTNGLRGLSLTGLPLRTRSKVVKGAVCAALGYPVPSSFKKTQPRFLGQQLDIYAQKSLNLQIWNEDLSPTRRYALVQISDADVVVNVRVVSGLDLAELDTTGTITTKYQARLELRESTHELVSQFDTASMQNFVQLSPLLTKASSPIGDPEVGQLLSIRAIFEQLSPLIGKTFPDPGKDQERNRGAALHRLVCKQLGYYGYEDNGRFPDIRHQLLEIKLQTSSTVDLGLVLPTSTERLELPGLGGYYPAFCDTRYAVFFASSDGATVTLTHLYVTTGSDFFKRFRRFEGKVTNGKIQIPLPRQFFSL